MTDHSRRDLLRLAAGGLLAPLATPLFAGDPDAEPALRWNRPLVLIELKGGNDGLNTVVPYTDRDYYRLRPSLAIAADQVLRLDNRLGLNPFCQPLMAAWQARELAIVQNVGYDRPNRSHFRGIDIWHGGTDSDRVAPDGWLARLLAGAKAADQPDLLADAIVWGHGHTVGHAGLGPLYGRELQTLVINRPEDFVTRARQVQVPLLDAGTAAEAQVARAQADLLGSADTLDRLVRTRLDLAGDFPASDFGRHLRQTAQLIAAGARIPVYKLTLDGFDTHAGQPGRHQQLLTDLAAGVAAFRDACRAASCWDQVLVMTYSEFGRRVAGNDSAGTDHGTAAPHFFTGGQVAGGLYGHPPLLGRLQNGDLAHEVDYRQLYTTVAEQWWGSEVDFLDRQRRYRALKIFKKS